MKVRQKFILFLKETFSKANYPYGYKNGTINTIVCNLDRIAYMFDNKLSVFYEKTPAEHLKMYKELKTYISSESNPFSSKTSTTLDYVYRNFLEMFGVNPKPIRRHQRGRYRYELLNRLNQSNETKFNGVGTDVRITLSEHTEIVLEKNVDGSYSLILS